MKAISNHFQKSIGDANGKPGAQHRPLNRMCSSILCGVMFSVSVSLKSQVQYTGTQTNPVTSSTTSAEKALVSNSTNCYLPVFFNYRRRQLKYNGLRKMDPVVFLTMCRGINDSIVQGQVARYDEYTREKQKLGFGALGCGFAAFGLLGGASAIPQGDALLPTSLVFTGVLALVAVPVIAIYSGVPHKKRKAVLFRDLPVAYNLFVESQQANPACAAALNQ